MEQKDIIEFAKSVYEAFPNNTTRADLLIREYIRNYQKGEMNIKDEQKNYIISEDIFFVVVPMIILGLIIELIILNSSFHPLGSWLTLILLIILFFATLLPKSFKSLKKLIVQCLCPKKIDNNEK